ncbi:PREDICTED: otoraplin [Tinamus guttatus]|uniref:otoraplin n=1 Tax=Tinamus guttatus TaxID=94827 RepID=UPI00052F16AB|nr:PREDICTED: otoraplin [Tinamus guttatus]
MAPGACAVEAPSVFPRTLLRPLVLSQECGLRPVLLRIRPRISIHKYLGVHFKRTAASSSGWLRVVRKSTLQLHGPPSPQRFVRRDCLVFGMRDTHLLKGAGIRGGMREAPVAALLAATRGAEAKWRRGAGAGEMAAGVLMCRGKAVRDFTGPDCRFVNFKKGEAVYVYYKLIGQSTELWAGSCDFTCQIRLGNVIYAGQLRQLCGALELGRAAVGKLETGYLVRSELKEISVEDTLPSAAAPL